MQKPIGQSLFYFYFLTALLSLLSCNNDQEEIQHENRIKARLDSAEFLSVRAPDSAILLYKELLTNKQELDADQLIKVKLGIIEARFLTGQQLEAIKEIQVLEQDAERRKDTAQLLKILILEGNFFIKRDQNEESKKVFERGLKNALALRDQRHIIRFRQGMATSMFGLNQYSSAIKEFKKVLSEAQILNDSDVLAVVYQNVALVYHQKQDLETCIDYQRHALTFNRKGIQSDSYAEMLNNLGAYYSSANRVDSALQCYLASERIYRGLKNPQGIIRSRFNQANIKLKQKKLNEAEKEFLSLMDEVKKYHITVGEFYVLNSLAEVKELQGNLSLSLTLFDSSLNHLLKNNMKYLGAQVMPSRLKLIKEKMKLDTNHLEFKKQQEYEIQFAATNNDSLLKQFKQDTHASKNNIKKQVQSNSTNYDWIFWTIGLSSLIGIGVVVKRRKAKASSQLTDISSNELGGKTVAGDFEEKLTQLFNNEQLWKDPNCTAGLIASKLQIDEATLQKLCSQRYKQSISEIVNKRRIDFACQQLNAANQHLPSLEDLAKESGFESTTHFYKAFTSVTGMQPHEYWEKRNFLD